jgi:hypothetical protein
LKKSGRSTNAIKNATTYVNEFELFLKKNQGVKGLDEANAQDLEDFVLWFEKNVKKSAKSYLWGIRYYYEFTSNEKMCNQASKLRELRIKRKSFLLRNFRYVNPNYVKKLASVGIKNVEQMLEEGYSKKGRQEISKKTDIPLDSILEFVKLSDLARIQGIKSIRARLYYDAGVDTIEKLAQWNPQELRTMLIEFVERSKFDGIAPLPKEIEFSIKKAKKLPNKVEY